jgi:hypothetical protein
MYSNTLLIAFGQLQQKRESCGNHFEAVKSSGRATMPGFHIRFEQQHIVALLGCPKLGNPFRRLPILNL